MLESLSHTHNAFVTLTYKEAPRELVPLDMQLFLKRLRKIYPAPFRFYGVGEYGTHGLRPHFHLILFGVSWMDRDFIDKAWGLGFVDSQEFSEHRAAYVAGYVCKKMTSYTNPELEGFQPEFARMSLKPGIGALQCESMGKELVRAFENGHVAVDVPGQIRQAGRKMPLGRYVRSKLRVAVGWDKDMPQDAKVALAVERQGVDRAEQDRKRESSYRSAIGRNKINQSRRKL